MVRENFYTGEPVTLTGSPSFSSESEAAGMASFGAYNYDSSDRSMVVPQQPIQQQPIQWNGNFQPINMGMGIGAPYTYPGYQQTQYSPYGNVMPFNRPFQQQFQMPPQPTTYHIPGFNPGGSEFLPSANFQEEIEQLELDYWMAIQEVDAKAEIDQQQSIYGGGMYGYNYYGMPYMNTYRYNMVNNEFAEKIDKMKQRARDNRIKLNIQLSKLCHNIAGDGVTEEEIIEHCTGKDIPAPPVTPQTTQNYYTNMRINNLVPFDNSSYYNNIRIQHQKELDEIFPEKCDMNQMFKCLGELALKYEMEDEMHRRKDLSKSYSSNTYKYFVRQKVKERYAAEHGMNNNTMNNTDNQFSRTFGNQILKGLPTLSQNATISDDGTLNVSLSLPVNVGDHRGEIYTVNNQNESEYDKKRERFGKFLDSIKTDGNPYLEDLKRQKFESTTFN